MIKEWCFFNACPSPPSCSHTHSPGPWESAGAQGGVARRRVRSGLAGHGRALSAPGHHPLHARTRTSAAAPRWPQHSPRPRTPRNSIPMRRSLAEGPPSPHQRTRASHQPPPCSCLGDTRCARTGRIVFDSTNISDGTLSSERCRVSPKFPVRCLKLADGGNKQGNARCWRLISDQHTELRPLTGGQ